MTTKTHRIELGDKVKDSVTGFTGIAVVRSEYLYGCTRIGVQPKLAKGKIEETQHFDEPQLIFTGSIAKELPNRTVAATKVGGYKEPPKGKSAPK